MKAAWPPGAPTHEKAQPMVQVPAVEKAGKSVGPEALTGAMSTVATALGLAAAADVAAVVAVGTVVAGATALTLMVGPAVVTVPARLPELDPVGSEMMPCRVVCCDTDFLKL